MPKNRKKTKKSTISPKKRFINEELKKLRDLDSNEFFCNYDYQEMISYAVHLLNRLDKRKSIK